MPEKKKYRLITRSDFDGLVCAVLLKELDLINDIKFVHPKDMQDGIISITDGDITTNLPYVKGVHLAFDHHESETLRNASGIDNHIIESKAPSAARVVYNYYGGKSVFQNISDELMDAVDKADSANFDREDILNPKGWVLLSFIMDARTGLGRFQDFRISNYQLMMQLIDDCRRLSIDEIMELPDVKERRDLYMSHHELFYKQIERCSKVCQNLVVLDLRQVDTIYAGNRFLIYALYPDCNISIHAMWGVRRQNTVFAIGKSIFNRTSKTNIGELCLKYGGGGHQNAGTCQVDNDKADTVLSDLIETITAQG